MAVGAASPTAQGQAMTITARANMKENRAGPAKIGRSGQARPGRAGALRRGGRRNALILRLPKYRMVQLTVYLFFPGRPTNQGPQKTTDEKRERLGVRGRWHESCRRCRLSYKQTTNHDVVFPETRICLSTLELVHTFLTLQGKLLLALHLGALFSSLQKSL